MLAGRRPSENKTFHRRKTMRRMLEFLALASIAIFALTGCISRTQYYARVPPSAPIGIDPIGGLPLFFWVDPGWNRGSRGSGVERAAGPRGDRGREARGRSGCEEQCSRRLDPVA